MADHATMRLGKRAPRVDARTLRLARYITPALPPAPAACDWGDKLTGLSMMLNDQLGDCTCAAMGHMVQAWTSDTGGEVVLADSVILDAYEKACGYDPADPNSDQGGVELDVLNWWRRNGLGGHRIGAFAALDPANEEHVRQAVYLFGGAYIGVSLPLSAQNQDVWKVEISGKDGDPAPGTWGGHAIPIVAYDESTLTCITWGEKKRMSWDWWRVYCDESYAILSQGDWEDGVTGKSPSGFEFAALQADLAAVSG
jgi:hypothetical protein